MSDTSTLELPDVLPVEERVSRRARCVRIDVRRDGRVVLTIPSGVPRAAALAFLHQRRGWIERARARVAQAAAAHPPMQWNGSDRLPLRGQLQAIEVEPIRGRRSAVHFQEDRIRVCVPSARARDTGFLKRVLVVALRDQARREAERVLAEESAVLGLRHAALVIRDPRSQWGSCSRDGRISLSWRLVLAPPSVFRYVVVHELCHLRWRGHGERFWALVARQMPDYELTRAWLRRHGEELHAALRS